MGHVTQARPLMVIVKHTLSKHCLWIKILRQCLACSISVQNLEHSSLSVQMLERSHILTVGHVTMTTPTLGVITLRAKLSSTVYCIIHYTGL